MSAVLEREVKLRPGTASTDLSAIGRELEPRVLWSRYLDTEDLRLAETGISLRRRELEGAAPDSAVWQLKLPSGRDRCELEWPSASEAAPPEITRLLLGVTRGRPLVSVATLRQHREGVAVESRGRTLAIVTHDRVEVVRDGDRVGGFDELEVELVDGDRETLKRMVRKLRKHGARKADGRSKIQQALDYHPPEREQPCAEPVIEGFVGALDRQYRAAVLHDPGARLGRDPEELHDLRVAIRRLRALLRAARPLVDRQWLDQLRASLQQAGSALAGVRDLDVFIADTERRVEALDDADRPAARELLDLVRARRDEQRRELAAELASPAYLSLLNRLEAAAQSAPVTGGTLDGIVTREHRRAVRRAKRALRPGASDSDLHELRKAVKHARYAAELADATGARGVRGYIRQAKKVQDLLGEHQDAVIAEAMIRDAGPALRHPLGRSAVTQMVRQQQERRSAVRRRLPRVWKRLHKRARVIS